MQFAFFNNQIIDAQKSQENSGPFYCCCCRQKVLKREGEKNIHHFYHNEGEPIGFDCENYHHSKSRSETDRKSTYFYSKDYESKLRLKLVEDNFNKLYFKLILPIPEPKMKGFVSVADSIQGDKNRYLSNNTRKNFEFKVAPSEKPYIVIFSNDVDIKYKQSTASKIDGLDPNGTIFRDFNHQGGRVNKGEFLTIGEFYFYIQSVFARELPSNFKPKEEINNKWEIFSFQCNERHKKFLKELSLNIRAPLARLQLFYPIIPLKNGTIQFKNNEKPIFQIINNDFEVESYNLKIDFDSGKKINIEINNFRNPFKLNIDESCIIYLNDCSAFRCEFLQATPVSNKLKDLMIFKNKNENENLTMATFLKNFKNTKKFDSNLIFRNNQNIEIRLISIGNDSKEKNIFKLIVNETSLIALVAELHRKIIGIKCKSYVYLISNSKENVFDRSLIPTKVYELAIEDINKKLKTKSNWLDYVATRIPKILSIKEEKSLR